MMNKNIFVRLLTCLAAVVLFFGGAQLFYTLYSRYRLKKNHKEVREYVESQLNYDPETIDEQLSTMQMWMENKYLYPEDYGMVYERASNIYKFRDDYANYARCFGYAIYYLEQSSDVDYTVNLELDLAMFYVVNNNYDLAREVVDRVLANIDVDNLQRPQVRSYLERFKGMLDAKEGNYDQAAEQILLAEKIMDGAPYDYYTDSYRGIDKVNLAKIRFYQGRYDEAEELLDELDGSELFDQTEYASIMARDFVLPYLETRIYLSLEKGEDVTGLLRNYVEQCETYGYNQWEVQTIMYVKDKLGVAETDEYREIIAMLENSYDSSAKYQGTRYTNLLNGIINDSYEHIKESYELKKRQRTRFLIYAALAVFLIWSVAFVWAFIKKSRLDGLTGIGSRGAFNLEMNKNKRAYGIIMIDIDNFKKVNDTYGHQKGDEVLVRLGQILMDMKSPDIQPFRYGGEEFVLVIYSRSLPLVVNIAEHVRKIFEAQEWDFGAHITISLGCAVSDDGDDVVKRADDNLYISKKTGKNKVTG